jgi:hypothetical protein
MRRNKICGDVFLALLIVYTVISIQTKKAQMKFLRSLLGLTRFDHQRNTTVRKKLKVEHIVDETQNYEKNWSHVKRMEHARIHRKAMEYQPKGKRDIGRPKTRWKDQQRLQD